MVTKTIF